MMTTSTLPKLWDDLSLRTYLGEIRYRHGIVDTLALPSMRDLPPARIETLFVSPLLAKTAVSPDSNPNDWPEGRSLLEALSSDLQLVVLGDPGSGKTTLSNWLAWRLSAGLSAPLPAVLDERIPLPCILRDMTVAFFEANQSIADVAEKIARHLLGSRADDELMVSLRARVEAGQYVLILDGLDEVSLAHRQVVATWIKQAGQQHACVLATSRIVGYDEAPVDGEKIQLDDVLVHDKESRADKLFKLASPRRIKTQQSQHTSLWAQRYYLMPFDQKRIDVFAENWYLQRCGSPQEAKQKARDLLASLAASTVTTQLARTPNLLSLMAIVHRERAHLPDGKALLYEEIANAYINTIDKQRKIEVNDLLAPYFWKERKAWLAYVGFKMQQQRDDDQPENSVLASEEEVKTWLVEAMSASAVNQPEQVASVFLDWVARRSGLLLPRGEQRYAFVHLSFQEYFCACYLLSRVVSPAFIRNQRSDKNLVNQKHLAEWADNTLWRETLIYLFELLSADYGPDWVDDLANVVFEGDGGLLYRAADLASYLLTNQHVRLSTRSKEQLGLRCVWMAVQEWRRDRSNAHVFFSLQQLGYAAAVGELAANRSKALGGVSSYPDFASIPELAKLRICCSEDHQLSDLSPLIQTPELSYLFLPNTSVAEVDSLSTLINLEHLDLSNTQITDISVLSGLENLLWLNLSNTQITDFSVLSELKKLQYLDLAHIQTIDFSVLSGLKNLWYLSLSYIQIRDISFLSELKNLQFLYLDNSQITDVSALSVLENLYYLSLRHTQITDVSALSGLKNLRHLDITNTQVTDVSALSKLKKLTITGQLTARSRAKRAKKAKS